MGHDIVRPCRPDKVASQGVTLIEIMVVIVIMAMVISGSSMALGAITRSKLRSATLHIVAASRFAFHRAITQGKTVRIVFNTQTHTMSIQEAAGTITLAENPNQQGRGRLGQQDETAAAVDPWQAAANALSETSPKKAAERSTSIFTPIKNKSGKIIKRYQEQPLGDSIRVVRVISAHEEQTSGPERALHYFPMGRAQHAVVHLSDNSNVVHAVEINSLTGNAQVYDHPYEPESLNDDDDSEIRDPG